MLENSLRWLQVCLSFLLKRSSQQGLRRLRKSKQVGTWGKLAQQLQMPPEKLRSWKNRQRIPQLETCMQLCAALNLPPMYLLTQHAEKTEAFQKCARSFDVSQVRLPGKPRRQVDRQSMQQVVEAALQEDPPPSRGEVARRLGYQPANLSQLFPVQCSAIAKRYRAYQSSKRAEGIQRRCDLVRQTVQLLHEQEHYPSKRQIELLLNKPGFLREAPVKAAWQEAMQELGLLQG